MTEFIEVSEPKITKLLIDVDNKKVIVQWAKKTNTGVEVEKGKFIFWKALPAIDNPPDNWFELSSGNLDSVVAVINLAQNFIDTNV